MGKTNYEEMNQNEKKSTFNYLNARDSDGKTPLYYAYENDNINLFEKIVKSGADLLMQYDHGTEYFGEKKVTIRKGLLQLAIQQDKTQFAKVIINNLHDLNQEDTYGQTPLILSVKKKNVELVELLLTKNIDLSARDKDDFDALYYSIKSQQEDIAISLIDKGAKTLGQYPNQQNLLSIATKDNQEKIAEKLLNKL